jgi:hypothetical protein
MNKSDADDMADRPDEAPANVVDLADMRRKLRPHSFQDRVTATLANIDAVFNAARKAITDG